MQNDDSQTRRKLAEIGARFLVRTIGEVATLQDLVSQLSSAASGEGGEVHGILKQIEMISHRIRGSGAVFGLDAISSAAEVIETLALRALDQSQIDQSQVGSQLAQAVATLSKECANSDGSPAKSK